MRGLLFILKFLHYYLTARTKHDIHSPFVFDFISMVIENKRKQEVFARIEKRRRSMYASRQIISIRDFGAGFGGKKFVQKRVRSIAWHSSKSPRYSRLLFRIVSYLKPDHMLEMGTSVGISAMYQAAANSSAMLTTMEGCENTAALAFENFNAAGISNIRIMTGDFDEILPLFLAKTSKLDYVFFDGNHRKEPVLNYFRQCLQKVHQKSCFIIDDLNWSAEMQQAWEEIKKMPQVTVTIDLFMMGLVFFNRDLSKENFTIRF